MEDEKIIDLYFARDEQALVQTELKYGSYCKAIARRYAMRPDSLNRNLLRTRKKLKDYLTQEGYAL